MVYFNPPYWDQDLEPPTKLMDTPYDMVYAYDKAGLYHYRRVLPELPNILSPQPGSSIIFRLPDYIDDKVLISQKEGSLGRVLNTTLSRIPGPKTVIYHEFDPAQGNKRACIITLQNHS